jgi:type I restriction enzyme S subunit
MFRSVKLKDISKLIGSGITPLRSNVHFWNNGVVYWLKTEQLGEFEIYKTSEKISQKAIDETSIKLFPINTLSIAMYGEGKTRGNVSILKNEMATNQACCNIILDANKANYRFVYYYLKTQYHQLRNLSSGVRKNLNSNDIKEFEIKLPYNLNTQEEISSILYSLDSKIQLNNRINAELEAMAKTLYDYWFVQFDFPDKNGKPYKTSGGKMVWSEELKREVPEGWEVEGIEKSCSIIDCLHSKKSDLIFEDEGSFLLQLENIKDDGLIDLTNKYYVTKEEYHRWTSRIEVKENDILITNAGRVAATAQMPKNIVSGIGRNITAIRPKKINPTYLFLSFRGADLKRQIRLNTDSGAFFTSFNVKGIKKLRILRPKDQIEEMFEDLVRPIRQKRELNNLENQKLVSLRDWLLPMLMNGQVRVN